MLVGAPQPYPPVAEESNSSDKVNREQTANSLDPTAKARGATLSKAMVPISEVKPIVSNQYLIKNWLDRGTSSVVYGESNVGKTFFALDLALHVAARLPWHGLKVAGMCHQPSPGKVYYFALEGGTGIRNRICAMRQVRPDIFECVEPDDRFVLWPTSIDLHCATDGDAIATAVNECQEPTALVVIDTLARAMGDGDENTARDMGQIIRNIDLIRDRTGAHVMVIHHSGKDARRGARGSGSLRGAVDTEIELTRSGGLIMATARKQRDMPADSVFAYTLRSVQIGIDEDGDPVTSAVVEPAEAVSAVPKLSGRQKIAMQALEEALADHGAKMKRGMFPENRECVSLDQWREYCDRHSLTSGKAPSSRRTAFHKVKVALQEKEIIRVLEDYVWKCGA